MEYDAENGIDWLVAEAGDRSGSTCAIYKDASGNDNFDRFYKDVLDRAEIPDVGLNLSKKSEFEDMTEMLHKLT